MPRLKNGTVNENRGRDQFVGDGPITVNNNAPSESVLDRLTPHVADNALHNAGSRANRHECLEGTRAGFIEDLGQWIENPEENGRVYWISAGAGVGKTAVAQTLCEKYFGSLLAAAHFFSRNDPSRASLRSFIPTIAYQLAKSPDLQPHLADAMNTVFDSDPRILGADWKDQFERLIYQPCQQVDPELWKTLPRLIIIDGLDECMDIHEFQSQGRDAWRRDGQVALLKIIQNSMTRSSPLPLRFLIFSRPEHTISNFFRTTLIPDFMQLDMRELRSEADSDIHLYLSQEFARLVKERSDAGLDASWPGKEALQKLTHMSDGHFIYVVTAVKYVMDDDPSAHPQERLDIIVHPHATKYPDLLPLDRLYLQILQPFADIREQLLLPLLQLIISPPSITNDSLLEIPEKTYRSRRILAELLNQPDSRHISIVLSRLRSVLYVPDDEHDEAVSVLHASFSDFLSDRRRSHDFHAEIIDRLPYLDKLSQSSLRVLKRMYANYQDRIRHREPPAVEAWAFNAWPALAANISSRHKASEEVGESLQGVNGFDVYRYVNMLNDGNYMWPLLAYHEWNPGSWDAFIVLQLLHLSQVYAFLTPPPDRNTTGQLYHPHPRSESRHNTNGSLSRFFEEDCVAVLSRQSKDVCYTQLKLLIGFLWDPIETRQNPTSQCGSGFPVYDSDDESRKGTYLKVFPHDIPLSTLEQSMEVKDCEIWRFGFGPWGTFKFRKVVIAPTASGDPGWVTAPSDRSDLHEWMAGFAGKQMTRAKEEREEKRSKAIKKWELVKQEAIKKQETERGPRRVEVFFRRLLCLDPESEAEEEREAGKRKREAEERAWEEDEKEWEEFVEGESRYHNSG
ncbi:hypothetical protein V5O48_016045 [Marasmius crinis-equi]|uniref:Nephrocystin 3-like N-terminal domain-containing protein n=1 Tax=Marasmius crinis-equi TaxID=585013 RepID=A0ABR3EST4_9AGAR